MPYRTRWGMTMFTTALFTTAFIIAGLITGCAAPTELAFDDAAAINRVAEATTTTGPDPLTAELDEATAAVDTLPDAIEKSFATLITGWVNCFHRPGRCDAALITAPNSPEQARLAASVAYYAAEQMRTKPDEGRLEWGIESISFTSADRARLITCEYDTRIFFDASMADTELGDIIFDSTIWTRRVEWTLANDNNSWQLWSRRIDRRSPAVRFCTP